MGSCGGRHSCVDETRALLAASRGEVATRSGSAADERCAGARAGSAESAALRSARRRDGGYAGNISNEIANANAARDGDERDARRDAARESGRARKLAQGDLVRRGDGGGC